VNADVATYWLSWVRLIQLVAVFLVALGVAAEFAGEWISRPLEKIIDSARESEIARLNAQAKQLEKEAANARLDTEKLKTVVAWRTLSAEQNSELKNVLSQKPGAVNLRWMDGDPEALFLAIQISQILQKAKWNVAAGALKPANSIAFGVVLPPDTRNDAQTLREALTAARIAFSSVPLPAGGLSLNVSTISDAPVLLIGSRLPITP